MVRSAPPQKASLPDVTTTPLMAASATTLSRMAESSAVVSAVMTFIDRPGISQVTSAMPAVSTSYLNMAIGSSPSSDVRLAGLVQPARGAPLAHQMQVVVRVMNALVRRPRADLDIDGVVARTVDEATRVAVVRLEAGAVAGLEHDLAGDVDQHQLDLEDEDELVLIFMVVPQRRRRARRDARQVDAELGQPNGVAERLLVAFRVLGQELRGISGPAPHFHLGDVDFGHLQHPRRQY